MHYTESLRAVCHQVDNARSPIITLLCTGTFAASHRCGCHPEHDECRDARLGPWRLFTHLRNEPHPCSKETKCRIKAIHSQ